MFSYIKVVSATCLVLLIAISAGLYLASYEMGFAETSYYVLSDPVIMGLPWLFLTIILVITWMISLMRRKYVLWTTSMLVGLVLVITAGIFFPSPRSLIVYGLRDRVMRDYGLDDLRHFAREVNQYGLLTGDRWINHGDTSDLSESEKANFELLKQKYAFLNWMKNGASILNYQDTDVVNFEWGGALVGHHGCSIRIDGKKNTSVVEEGTQTISVSDDIYFYLSPD